MSQTETGPTIRDEPCGICGDTWAAHQVTGVYNHEHSPEGILIQKKPRPDPMRRPAVPGDTVILRLIGTLANKGILTPDDLGKIFPPSAVIHDPKGN